MKITRKSLWIDADQGTDRNDRAFGFIGTSAGDDYQGWFFSWPREQAGIETDAELEAVIDSMEADEITSAYPQIPYRYAVARLRTFLDARLAKSQYASLMAGLVEVRR